ncbi:DUF6023 family protein [Arthrobacter sp. ok362]|jgi:hypothetical protein|uniref:DUF6023 family protein n=1 Tax=Arthrobacter sp. ok362 TaxID=1761745 RepID=UPI000883726B|nr:DUF6023 family protein [Arthrobacter sp. ok362]SDK63847.1 hypothetical protein SAMN04487913_102202 [Arthrobacter sp. ok362]
MPTVPASRAPRQRTSAAAVVLSVAVFLGAALSGCEYEYSADRWDDESTSVAPTTDAALPKDPHLTEPVSGQELDAWVHDVLPDAAGQVFHTGVGTLEADEEREETTARLPKGTYALTLACRSARRVSFSIENGEIELVDLALRCGTTRVNVVQLAADAALSIKVDANGPANYAYRVSRI